MLPPLIQLAERPKAREPALCCVQNTTSQRELNGRGKNTHQSQFDAVTTHVYSCSRMLGVVGARTWWGDPKVHVDLTAADILNNKSATLHETATPYRRNARF